MSSLSSCTFPADCTSIKDDQITQYDQPRKFKTALLSMLMLMIVGWTSNIYAEFIRFDVQKSHEAVIKGQKNTIYLKVALQGLTPPARTDRPPLNVALVIDRSGSMRGNRLKRAKEATKMAVNMLNENDIVSIIAYDTEAEVLIPATKVSNKAKLLQQVDAMRVRGSTALYAGVQLGGKEVKKFLDNQSVNRVILLSDGMANVGPSSPAELAKLGRALGSKGVSVSTIGLGLGYNEDLMSQLAAASDGNHSFVEHAEQLAQTMNLELNDALSVVAKNIEVTIECEDGVRPVKMYGREADFDGQEVSSKLNQMIAGHEKFLLLEVEVDANKDIDELAQVKIKYYDPLQEKNQSFEATTKVKLVTSKSSFDQHEIAKVMEDVVVMLANEKQKMAVQLRDEGKSDEAYQLMQSNIQYLEKNATRYKSKKLKAQSKSQKESSKSIRKKGTEWNRTRKKMKRNSYQFDSQQAF